MHNALSEDDVLSAEQIVEALDRKRRQLDAQIERFKLLKEQEYRAHEHWLKKTARQRDLRPKKTTRNRQSNFGSQQSSPPSGLEGLEPELPQRRELEGDTFNRKPIDSMFTTAFYGQQGLEAMVKQQQGQTSPSEAPHEREAEFAGVFTPSFLPLLDGGTDDKNRYVKEEPPSLYIKDESLTSPDVSVQRTDSNLLSSSAQETSTRSVEQTEPRRLSISAPGPNGQAESKHSRSTSDDKSDTSLASRRSSFKDPNTPRSPKRVMFDIDNTVVSPSTSPLIERKAPLMKKSKKVDENGEEQFEIVKKKPHKHKKHGYHRKGRRVAGDERNMEALGLAQAEGENEKGEAFVDDFEKVSVGDEDMFSFDEDLDLSKEPGGKEKWTDEAGFGGEEDAGRAVAPLTGSSPHAGSLPIEIQWPGRRSEGAG